MEESVKKVRVYRYHDSVAINFCRIGEVWSTHYLDQPTAAALAKVLESYAHDISKMVFSKTSMGTVTVDKDGVSNG